MDELINRRNIFSKTYSNDGRHYRTEISSAPIHYQKDDGSWDEINIYLYSKSDKWLIEKNNVTVGFRKDGSLYKYFGLRYDYDHQFECTFKSIKFNDNEQIPEGTTGYTNIIKESDNTISHYIGDLKIYNEIFRTYFRNYVEVTDIISGFTSIEQIHLYGLQIANKFSGTTGYDLSGETIWTEGYYLPDEKNEFYIIDDEWNFRFKIPNPIIKDISGNTITDNINHRLLYSDGSFLYEKTATDLQKLNYPLLIDSSADFSPINDGYVYYNGTTNWTNTRNSSVGTFADNTTDPLQVSVGNSIPNYTIRRSFMTFNTTLSSNSLVVNAELSFYISTMSTSVGYDTEDLYIQKGTQSTTLTTTDFDQFDSPLYVIIQPSTGQKNINMRGSSFIDNINVAGYTKLCLRNGYDYKNTGSVFDTITGGDDILNITSSEGANPPKLNLIYTDIEINTISIKPINNTWETSTKEWYINSASTNLTSQLSNFDGIKIFHLDYISGKTSIVSGLTSGEGEQYYDLTVTNTGTKSSNEFNLLSLTTKEDIIELELENQSLILSGSSILSKTVNGSTITYRFPSGLSIAESSSEDTVIIVKSRYILNGSTYVEIGDFLYENLSYSGGYTKFSLNKNLLWNRIFFVDNVFKTSGMQFKKGTYKSGTFSANWYDGIWGDGIWAGKNIKTNNLEIPTDIQSSKFQRKNLTVFPSSSEWKNRINSTWWQKPSIRNINNKWRFKR